MRNALKPLWAAVSFLVRNLLALSMFVLIGFGVQVLERRMFGWPVPNPPISNEPAALLACTIGVVIAWRLRARPAMFFVAGTAAWRLAMFLIRNIYGSQWARNEAQFAAMVTGLVGVIFGALLAHYARRSQHSSAAHVSTQAPALSSTRSVLSKPLKPIVRFGTPGGLEISK
jgi:hypothetical protein